MTRRAALERAVLKFLGVRMRVYYTGAPGADMDATVAPAADPRGIAAGVDSDWIGADGKPRGIVVRFRSGFTEVPDALGRYLVAIGMAKRTALILPPGLVCPTT